MTGHRGRRILCLGPSSAIVAVVVAASAGCGGSDTPPDTGDCVSPLVYEGRPYLLAASEQAAEAGDVIGTGTFEPCTDGTEDDDGRHATIYLAAEGPAEGWDQDLRVSPSTARR